MFPTKLSRMGTRFGWLVVLWLGGVGAVFVFACLMRLAMRLAGMSS